MERKERPINGGRKRKLTRKEVWEEFVSDKDLLWTYNISEQELKMLREAALLGRLESKEDYLFILSQIRLALRR